MITLMKLKVYSISILSLLSLCVGGVAFVSLSNDKAEEAEAYTAITAGNLPQTIDLNDTSDSNIRNYYSSLNSLSVNQRQGNNLLINLKTILKNGQNYYSFDVTSNNPIWRIYEISDRDWVKSPATGISGYNSATNKIIGYTYGTSATNSQSNPYIHALYVNREANTIAQICELSVNIDVLGGTFCRLSEETYGRVNYLMLLR